MKDKHLLTKGGSSDPLVRFQVGDLKFESTVMRATLDPIWHETFVHPLPPGDGLAKALAVTVEDWDEATLAAHRTILVFWDFFYVWWGFGVRTGVCTEAFVTIYVERVLESRP